jgi:hypothetical protein
MEQKLKELIQLSIVDGSITQEKREYIYSKASESGVDKTECDIFIDSLISNSKTLAETVSINKKNRGWYFIVIGIVDFLWLCHYIDVAGSYVDNFYAGLQFWSSVIFILVGSYILGWLNKNSATKIGIVIFSYLIPYLLFKLLSYIIHIPFRAIDNYSLYRLENYIEDLFSLLNWVGFLIFIYLFKSKLFGKEFSKKINFLYLDSKLNPFKNKLPDWLK